MGSIRKLVLDSLQCYCDSSAFLFFLMFIYLWLCWIFVAVGRLSLVVSGATPVAVLGFLIVVASLVAASRASS